MSFWINYTGRRDEYPLPDVVTNRVRLRTKSKLRRKKKPKKTASK